MRPHVKGVVGEKGGLRDYQLGETRLFAGRRGVREVSVGRIYGNSTAEEKTENAIIECRLSMEVFFLVLCEQWQGQIVNNKSQKGRGPQQMLS